MFSFASLFRRCERPFTCSSCVFLEIARRPRPSRRLCVHPVKRRLSCLRVCVWSPRGVARGTAPAVRLAAFGVCAGFDCGDLDWGSGQLPTGAGQALTGEELLESPPPPWDKANTPPHIHTVPLSLSVSSSILSLSLSPSLWFSLSVFPSRSLPLHLSLPLSPSCSPSLFLSLSISLSLSFSLPPPLSPSLSPSLSHHLAPCLSSCPPPVEHGAEFPGVGAADVAGSDGAQ